MIKFLTSGREFIFPEQFSVDKSTALCFTGHREKNIPPYNELYKYKNLTLEALKLLMSRYIDIAIECGYTSFISGFAEGFDLWAAHHVIKRKNDGAGISLIGAVPYLHHADRFSSISLALLKEAELHADELVLICPNPDAVYSFSPISSNQSKTLYRDRNYFMADHSSAVIAFINENLKWSGTLQTLNYSKKNNLKICRFGLKEVYSLIEQGNFNLSEISKLADLISSK